MLAATKLGHAIQEHWSCHTRTKVSPRAQAHRPGELPSISELKLSGCRACSAGRDECLPRCKKVPPANGDFRARAVPCAFCRACARCNYNYVAGAARCAAIFLLDKPPARRASHAKSGTLHARNDRRRRGGVYLRRLPLAIIGLFIVSILDRRRGRAGEFAKRSVPVSEEAARGGEAARIRIRESRVRASRPVGAPPRPHAVAQHRKPSGEFLDAPREDCACDR